MVSKWSQFEIEQKTSTLVQSKQCAMIMNSKEKVLKRSGSYGWTYGPAQGTDPSIMNRAGYF